MTCFITHEGNMTTLNHCVPLVEECVNHICVEANNFSIISLMVIVSGIICNLLFLVYILEMWFGKSKPRH